MTLLAEIQAKVSAEILATRDPQAIADAFNSGRVRLGRLEREHFTTWAASCGMRSKIEDLSLDKTSPLRDSALACRDVIGGAAQAIDFANPANKLMLDVWLAYGMVTQVDYDALIAMSTKPDPISLRDITMAVQDDTGAWRY